MLGVLSSVSTDLDSISTILNKLSSNFSSFGKLLNMLEDIKKSISIADNKTINDIEEYNKLSSDIMKKVSINVMRIEEFLVQNNQVYHFGININMENMALPEVPTPISMPAPAPVMAPSPPPAPTIQAIEMPAPTVPVAPVTPIMSQPTAEPIASAPIEADDLLQEVNDIPLDIFKYLRPENRPGATTKTEVVQTRGNS